MRKRGKQRRHLRQDGGLALLMNRHSHAIRSAALSRPMNRDEEHALLIPARISSARLHDGSANIQDLHNIAAFLNVGSVLARDADEIEAFDAIQAGLFCIIDVKGRGGPVFAMNAVQRSAIGEAVSLTDELFCCTTLLDIATAHHRVMKSIPLTGTLERVDVDA